ncbi:uncharacterized protein LOC109503862 isoform X2 [Harpegnathos saltator]|uniref:uncharacterized protein LOC109503862 isoform X2 n=1 Tax=Harpegnathos saltator TaxID=610380 RepID=UPI000948CD85|nr:uncharacterized protein LOC109503862 isoform X2 [Harpegnathos saltator]
MSEFFSFFRGQTHPDVCKDMTCFDLHQHFAINRILLLLVGLWPYQQSNIVHLQKILFSSILSSFILFQLTSFLTAKCTPDFIVKISCSVLLFAIYLILYNTFHFNTKHMIHSLDQLQHVCNELQDENEIAIIERYACIAERKTIILTVFSSVFVILVQPTWPRIFDTFLLTNNSLPRHKIQIFTEYFIDQERYFYLIALHTFTAFLIGVIVTVATGTMILTNVKHICGMFLVASYRIQQAIKIDDRRIQKNTICKDIICAINIHRKAMKFAEFILKDIEIMLFVLVLLSVSCLSLNLFRITSFGGDIVELWLHLAYTSAIILYMFEANLCGQEVTDHNKNIFYVTYNAHWYTTPLNIQKLIILLLQRGNKPFFLNVGGLFTVSLENFAMLLSASISYFTVMYSMQTKKK